MRIKNCTVGGWLAVAVTSVVFALPLAGSASERGSSSAWVPGEPFPTDELSAYPCHDYEKACFDLTLPDIERVGYTGPRDGDPKRGEEIATNIRWGNCLTCHALPSGDDVDRASPGTIGPSLEDYADRNLPFEYTFQRIWDTRLFSPNAHMPIYGPNEILSVQDILDVIAFLHSDQ